MLLASTVEDAVRVRELGKRRLALPLYVTVVTL
jgi:hypothetical protein